MTVIDEVLAANEIYSRTHELRRLTPRPERKLAVLTCMDTRLSTRTLGLKEGDAHIIRNAGGIVTDDTLRSLVVSHYLLGTEEFMVINHTDCGLMHTSEQDLRNRIQNHTGTAAVAPAFFYAFQNIEENVRHQLQKLRTHPWIPKNVAVRGFVNWWRTFSSDRKKFMVINHTDCGLMHTSKQDLHNKIKNHTETAAVAPAFFYAFQNIEENVRHQLQKLRTHPWIPKNVAVRGFVNWWRTFS